MLLARYLLLALVGWALTACAAQPPPPTPTSTAAPPTPMPITVTPTLAASLPSPQVVESETGQVQALGLIHNRAPQTVADIELLVKFLTGTDEDVLHQVRGRPLLPHLAPGEASPFVVPFRGTGSPNASQAEVLRYTEWTGERAEIEVVLTRALPAVEEGTRVLGYVHGLGDSAAQIDGFEVAAVGEEGWPSSLAAAVTAPTYLAQGDRIPFQAELGERVPLSSVRAYMAASKSETVPSSALQVDLTPGWQEDPQGNPFLLGAVRNSADRRQSGQILLSFQRDSALLGVVALDSPIPLAGGELRPFAVPDPPLIRGTDPRDVQVGVFVQPPADPDQPATAVTLNVQVTAAETLGSQVFLRGFVSNPGLEAASTPTLFVALRATEGTLWSAAWHPLGPELAPGEDREFVLPLPLPGGADVPLGEFDVRALGASPP